MWGNVPIISRLQTKIFHFSLPKNASKHIDFHVKLKKILRQCPRSRWRGAPSQTPIPRRFAPPTPPHATLRGSLAPRSSSPIFFTSDAIDHGIDIQQTKRSVRVLTFCTEYGGFRNSFRKHSLGTHYLTILTLLLTLTDLRILIDLKGFLNHTYSI